MALIKQQIYQAVDSLRFKFIYFQYLVSMYCHFYEDSNIEIHEDESKKACGDSLHFQKNHNFDTKRHLSNEILSSRLTCFSSYCE